MATQTTTSADAFYKQLGRMYGTYTGGFVAFIVLLAILEQIGVPNKILGYLFVFFTLAVYAIIGVVSRILAPEAERDNWGARKALELFKARLGQVTRQLARSPYLAGDDFTAADISVTYALEFAQRTGSYTLGVVERAYVARTSGRDGYRRAMETCQGTKAWAESMAGR